MAIIQRTTTDARDFVRCDFCRREHELHGGFFCGTVDRRSFRRLDGTPDSYDLCTNEYDPATGQGDCVRRANKLTAATPLATRLAVT